jgi:oligopeptide transport system substrate-binding protein
MRSRGVRRVGGGATGALRLSRRDFLKLGGTGLAGAALLGTASCGIFEQGGGQGGNGDGDKAIAINLAETIRDLDSTTTTDSVSLDVLLNVMSGLYRLDPDQQPVPDLAEGVEISDDQLTYTFTLRDGIEWSDGDPVTAEDFRYAWLRALDPDTAGQYAYIIYTFIEGAEAFNAGEGSADDVAIEAPDDKTLEVKLVAPSPFWLGLTSFFAYLPQKQSFVEEQGEQYAQSADALLYTGPYTLTEFDPTNGVTMFKNDQYWDRNNVDIERVRGRIVKEQDTAVNLFESGELDETEIDSQYVDEYQDSPEFWSQTYFSTFYLVFNEELPLFQNENVRKAFQMGFDREALANDILNNGSEAAGGFVPAGMASGGPGDEMFREVQGSVVSDFDAEEARRLFEQGVEEVGENPTIELLGQDDSSARDIVTFLQSQFEENLGANITVNVQPFDRKLELEANGEFQLSAQGWIADYNDPINFLELFESDSSFNTQGYSNERFDQLIQSAREETDLQRREDMLLEAERVLLEEDAGTAPMYFEGKVRLVRNAIKNIVDHRYGAGLDVKWWRLEE